MITSVLVASFIECLPFLDSAVFDRMCTYTVNGGIEGYFRDIVYLGSVYNSWTRSGHITNRF